MKALTHPYGLGQGSLFMGVRLTACYKGLLTYGGGEASDGESIDACTQRHMGWGMESIDQPTAPMPHPHSPACKKPIAQSSIAFYRTGY